jgi:hypothetical protein
MGRGGAAYHPIHHVSTTTLFVCPIGRLCLRCGRLFAIQQHDVIQHHFGGGFWLAIFSCPAPGGEPSFDIDLSAFAKILIAHFRKFLPSYRSDSAVVVARQVVEFCSDRSYSDRCTNLTIIGPDRTQ